jgi:hypothetical protein
MHALEWPPHCVLLHGDVTHEMLVSRNTYVRLLITEEAGLQNSPLALRGVHRRQRSHGAATGAVLPGHQEQAVPEVPLLPRRAWCVSALREEKQCPGWAARPKAVQLAAERHGGATRLAASWACLSGGHSAAWVLHSGRSPRRPSAPGRRPVCWPSVGPHVPDTCLSCCTPASRCWARL